jgi:hypothetical protein
MGGLFSTELNSSVGATTVYVGVPLQRIRAAQRFTSREQRRLDGGGGGGPLVRPFKSSHCSFAADAISCS